MQPEALRRLAHVRDAGETLITITSGKTFAEYEKDVVLRLAVERSFTIIGEALKEAGKADAGVVERVSGFRRIVDFRNVVVHDYMALYHEGVWRLIHEHLPLLLTEVRALLAAS
jgi:uncharacterized protein with HEPN domain